MSFPSNPVRRERNWIATVAIVFAIVITLGVTSIYVANRRAVTKAAALAKDVSALRIDQTTDDEVLRLAARYGGDRGNAGNGACGTIPDRARSVVIENETLNRLGLMSYLGRLRLFGNRAWVAGADFSIKDGRLCWADYWVHGFVTDYSYLISLNTQTIGPQNPDAPYTVRLQSNQNNFAIRNYVSATASPEQHEHAFDIRLDCLTRFGGCKTSCEVMPSAWFDAEQEAQGYPFPPPGWNAIGCTKSQIKSASGR